MEKPELCLCMIVKNESHIIKETLENVKQYIDYWVICDTGSTDGTQDIIKEFFKEANIKGELFEHEWKNFGHNRTLAFKSAYNKSDYVLVMDADDLIKGDFKLPHPMDKDGYMLKYGDENFQYYRAQIFKNNIEWHYKGILHEYAEPIDKHYKRVSEKLEGNYYIDSRRLGNRNLDPLKYQKDAKLLADEIEVCTEPQLLSRYCFYAGQSYRDCHDWENAIKYYKKRTELGGWLEEISISWMEIGCAKENANYPKKEIIEAYQNSFRVTPHRAESLFMLGNYYLKLFEKTGEHLFDSYNAYALSATKKHPVNDILFVRADIYSHKAKEQTDRLAYILKLKT